MTNSRPRLPFVVPPRSQLMSAPAMQAGTPPKSTPADAAALAEARTLVRDLFTARPGLYWFDFLTSTAIGWAAFVMRSEEHTSALQSLMRNSYAVFCLKKKNTK